MEWGIILLLLIAVVVLVLFIRYQNEKAEAERKAALAKCIATCFNKRWNAAVADYKSRQKKILKWGLIATTILGVISLSLVVVALTVALTLILVALVSPPDKEAIKKSCTTRCKEDLGY